MNVTNKIFNSSNVIENCLKLVLNRIGTRRQINSNYMEKCLFNTK